MNFHSPTASWLRRISAAIVVASFFAAQAVDACPGCKQAIGGDGAGGNRTVNGVGVAYALSIGFMLFMIAFIIGSVGYMAYRNCMALAAQHRAAEESAFAIRAEN